MIGFVVSVITFAEAPLHNDGIYFRARVGNVVEICTRADLLVIVIAFLPVSGGIMPRAP